MVKTEAALSILLALSSLTWTGCEDEEGENETNISAYGDTESHHTGENCMTCHHSSGSGQGWFTVAGTVYHQDLSTTYPNTTVRVYAGPDGTGELVTTVEVDGKGNFYSTEPIDWADGLYVSVSSSNETRYMASPLTTGACNSCHGSSRSVIFVN